MIRKAVLHAGLALGVAVASACSDPTETDPPPPNITTANAVLTKHPLVASLVVALEDSAAVEVSYHATTGGSGLRVTADSVASHHQLQLTRLRAGTTYSYEVRSRNAAGRLGKPTIGTVTSGPLPAGLADFVFETSGIPTRPVTLMQVSAATNGWFGVIATDASGAPVWFHRTKTGAMGFMRRPNGDIAIIDNGIFVIGPRGDTVASLPPASSAYGTIHHGIANSPTGGILFIANDKRTIADTVVTGDGIFEWDPATNVVVKRWTAFDFFDWRTQRTTQSAANNWLHANAVNVGPRGNVILSMRNMNQVASIAADFKSVEWRLGGPGATISMPSADLFYGQHGAREISPGRVLVFDNGFDRPSAESFSRGLEIAVDATARTATKMWEYRETPDNLAVRLGSVHRYSNGNTFMTFGWLSPSPIQIVEVTAAGQKVYRIAPVGTVIEKIYASEPVTTLFGETGN
jgi:hypothetical protein